VKLTIRGATGRIGRLALDAAIAAGHDVAIVTRQPPEPPVPALVTVIVGSLDDRALASEALGGRDALISAVGPSRNTAEAADAIVGTMRSTIAALQAVGLDRIVALSGAAVEVPGDDKPAIDRVVSRFVRVAARHVVDARIREFAALADSDLAWTALRPAIVVDGPARGYRLSTRLQPGARTTRADVAQALVDAAASGEWIRQAPFVLPPGAVTGGGDPVG
jgi:nucleoside-diphosphate-sugar epimerase